MSIKLMWVALMALLTTFAAPSWASDNLPTSENPAKGEWRVMKPSSFKADMFSVLQQCNRAAAVSRTDRLTAEMCQKLPTLIKGEQCQEVSVKDGVVFDYMNGHEGGLSKVTKNVEKALGGNHRALICDLGNRTSAYWFTGEKRSCNNIGIAFTAVPKVAVKVDGVCGSNANRYGHAVSNWPVGGNFCASGEQSPRSVLFPVADAWASWSCLGKNGGKDRSCDASRDAVPTTPPAPAPRAAAPSPEPKCAWVPERYIVPQQGQVIYIPGLTVAVCNGQVAIPATFVNIPGDVMTVTRQKYVCQPN